MSYNRSYHRFFEGYVEKKVTDPATGKTRIERVYAGDYYRHRMDDRSLKRLKRTYILIYVWAFVCILLQGTGKSATEWYTIVPILLGMIAMVWLGFYVCAYAASPRELTIRQYRDREMLKTTAMASALCAGLSVAAQAVWMIAGRRFYLRGLIGMLLEVTAAIGLYYMFRTERDMDYVKRENKKPIDPDSYDIRYREE